MNTITFPTFKKYSSSWQIIMLFSCSLLLSQHSVAQRATSIDSKGTRVTTGNVVTEAPTAPTTPTPIQGDVWFDTANNLVKVWDGAWKTVASTNAADLKDDQKINTFQINGDNLELEVEDGGGLKTVALNDVAREPWFGDDDDKGATTNTEDIYHLGSKVGIGTTNPTANLEVSGNGDRTVLVKGSGFSTASVSVDGRRGSPGANSSELNLNLAGNAGGQMAVRTTTANSFTQGGNLFLRTAPDSTTGLQDRVVVSSQGDVGIATTTPTEKLDVDGQARIRMLTQTSNNIDEVVVVDATGVLKRKEKCTGMNSAGGRWSDGFTLNVQEGRLVTARLQVNCYNSVSTVVFFHMGGLIYIVSSESRGVVSPFTGSDTTTITSTLGSGCAGSAGITYSISLTGNTLTYITSNAGYSQNFKMTASSF